MAIRLQQIIDKANTLIDGISVPAGYHFDLGSFNAVDHPDGKQVETWLVNVFVPAGEMLHEWSDANEDQRIRLDVELTRVNTTATQADLIQAMMDVRKALHNGGDRTWGGLIMDITPAGFDHPKNQLGEYEAGVLIVHFDVTFRTAMFGEE